MDSDPIPKTNSAMAIERDRAQTGPPRLQHLDLLAQENREQPADPVPAICGNETTEG